MLSATAIKNQLKEAGRNMLGIWAGFEFAKRQRDIAVNLGFDEIFLLSDNPALELKLSGLLFRGHGDIEQVVQVFANDIPLGNWSEGELFAAVIPEGTLGRNGELRLDFLIGCPTAPYDVGINSDKRRLGLFLSQISFYNNLKVIKMDSPHIALSGFSGNENGWRWTDGYTASVTFTTEEMFHLLEINKDIDFDEIDEVYIISHYNLTPKFRGKFKNAQFFLLEEGLSSYMRYNEYHEGAKEAFFLVLNDKLDFINDKNLIINRIDKQYFKKTIAGLNLNKIKLPFEKNDKVIFLLTQYNVFSYLGVNSAISIYMDIILKLLALGYKIIIKPHPRNDYLQSHLLNEINSGNIFILVSDLPAEVFDLDIAAVVSISSGALFSMSHLYDVAAFSFTDAILNIQKKAADIVEDKFYAQIVKEYIPSIDVLYNFGNVENIDKDVCKEKLKRLFDEFIKKQSRLSQNSRLASLANKLVAPKKYLNNIKIWEIPKLSQIRIETSNKCGYRCFMCPRLKLTRSVGTMPIGDLETLLDRFDYIKYECDMHLHGYGEALLCDDLPERVKLITSRKPNFTPYIFTTLGYAKGADWFEALLRGGLRKILISCYGYDPSTYKAVHGVDRFQTVKENLRLLTSLKRRYPSVKLLVQLDGFGEAYPSGTNPNDLQKLRDNFNRYLLDLGIPEKNIGCQTLHNFGDGFDSLGRSASAIPCSICWGHRRSHLSVLWNMDVVPCAYDYNGDFVWGNLKEQSIEEIFAGEKRNGFIRELLEDHPPKMCYNCYPNHAYYDEELSLIQEYAAEKRANK